MRGWKVLGLVAVLALAVAVSSCGDEPSSAGPAHVESTVPHERATA